MKPAWACGKWDEWGHDLAQCKVCSLTFTAFQIANAPAADHFYEMYIQLGRGGGFFVFYRSATDLPWDDVPGQAVRDGMLGEFHLQDVEYVIEVTPEEYYANMWV